MSESTALGSEQFSKKLSDKVAAKLAAASASSNKPSASNKNKSNTSKKPAFDKSKPERKGAKDNTKGGDRKPNFAQNNGKKKTDFKKQNNEGFSKASGSNKISSTGSKDGDLKKEVGDLIDSLGFEKAGSAPRNVKKQDGKQKPNKQKGKKDASNDQQKQQNDAQHANKKEKPKFDKKNKNENAQKSDKFDKKERANKGEGQGNNSDKPKGGALKEIDTIVTSLEKTFEDDESSSLPPLTNEFHQQNKPMFEPVTEWYNITTTSDGSDISFPSAAPDVPLSASRISALHSQAKSLLNRENELFIHEGNKSFSQKQFLSQLLTAGTLSDKISAYTLLVQESPLHSIKYLSSLLGLCRKKSRGNALHAIGALKDMFVNGVLPDRKLKYFKNQPTLSNKTPTEVLVLWAFEDWLKQFFFSLVQILEILSHDTVTFVRTSTVDHILDLLRSKPEQEANLLRLGVNKLGDKEKQVASRVSYLILKIEEVHPAMNAIIASSVSELIFRPGSDYHARYYSIITLNQTILTHKNKSVANTLIRTYLSLFELLLSESNKDKKKGEEEEKPQKKPRHKNRVKGQKARQTPVKTSEAAKEEEFDKLISAILTGMNRAYPFSDLPKDVFENHMNTIYRVTHSANFNTGVQALILLFQMTQAESKLSDRFYRTLYESLFDPRLTVSSKLRLYLNLMFKALKQDSNKARVKAFVKRLVQVSNHWINIGIIAGVVFLVDELKKADPAIMKALIDDSPALSSAVEKAENSDSKSETEEGEEKSVEEEILDKYDGRKRDPTFANAENTKVWEVVPLLQHFHPTVAFYTQHYLGLAPEGAAKPIQPDLSLYSLSHFLDRFVYRNPKQKVVTRGTSIMQPLAGSDPTGLVFTASGNYGLDNIESGISTMPVNVADWKNMKLDDVDAGDRFFHSYFNMVQQNRKEGPKKPKGDDLDLDSEEAEKEIWKALVNSNPSIEDAGDVDDSDMDLSMADMSDDDDDDDDEELAALQELAGDDDDDDDDDEDDDDDDDDGEAGFFNELEDNDDALGSDDEVPLGDKSAGDDFESQFEQALAKGKTNKRTRDEADGEEEEEELDEREKAKKARKAEKKDRRKKLKELPLYASADDYAQYLSD